MASDYSHFSRVSTPLVRATAASVGTLNVSAGVTGATVNATTLTGSTTTVGSVSIIEAINLKKAFVLYSTAAGTYTATGTPGFAATDVIPGGTKGAVYFRFSNGAALTYGQPSKISIAGANQVYVSDIGDNSVVIFDWIDVSV